MKQTKKMEFYTDEGRVKRYDETLSTVDIARLTRKELKIQFPDCKFSVTSKYFSMGSEISVSLVSAPFEAFIDASKDYVQVSTYCPDEDSRLTDKAKEVLKKVCDIVESRNFSDCDSMIDYCHVNFYFHLNVGEWDKPFQKVDKKEKVKAPKKAKESKPETCDSSDNMERQMELTLELMKLNSWIEKSRTSDKVIRRVSKDYPKHIIQALSEAGKITCHPKSKYIVINQ